MSSSSDWLSESEAIALAGNPDTSSLAKMASQLRDSHHGDLITYSRKVFVPLTQLCRDVCHYCTFAQTPRHLNQAFMSPEEVLTLCQAGAEVGCQEALFTLAKNLSCDIEPPEKPSLISASTTRWNMCGP